MSRRKLRPETGGEPQACDLVHAILGVPVCRNDTGVHPGQADAVIHPAGPALDDGYPLEVIRVTNPARRAQREAVAAKTDGMITITGLRRGYTVILFEPTLKANDSRWLQRHLQAYERWELDPDHQPPISLITPKVHIVAEPPERLTPGTVHLMTAAAHSSPALPPRGLYATMLEGLFAPGGAVGSDVVDKLVRHDGQQRHAFVWGEASDHEVLTHVWLALNQTSAIVDIDRCLHRPRPTSTSLTGSLHLRCCTGFSARFMCSTASVPPRLGVYSWPGVRADGSIARHPCCVARSLSTRYRAVSRRPDLAHRTRGAEVPLPVVPSAV